MAKTLTTAAELDALPVNSYGICGCGYYMAKWANDLYVPSGGRRLTKDEVAENHLPFTVLYRPDDRISRDLIPVISEPAEAEEPDA